MRAFHPAYPLRVSELQRFGIMHNRSVGHTDIPARLAVGARVEHPLRGLGTVSSHQASDPCKVFVAFDNGESHGYREHSWPKLNPPGSMPHAPLFPPTGDSIRVE